ncbi:hypothetical protein D3C80_1680150 [compost metagenome]
MFGEITENRQPLIQPFFDLRVVDLSSRQMPFALDENDLGATLDKHVDLSPRTIRSTH